MSARRILLALALASLIGACAPSGTSLRAGPAASPIALPLAQPGARPIVIDTDLAGDDILAIMTLLRDPAVDVRAITLAGTGEVHCAPGLRNARRLLAAFGRSDVPVACGPESPGPNGRAFPEEWRAGADAFYGIELPAVDGESSLAESAAQLLVRATTGQPEPVTIVAIGPWTNLVATIALDAGFTERIAGIHAMGGAIDVEGNIDFEGTRPQDGVEWNFGADPAAVAAVLATDVSITVVPLDATNDVPVPVDIATILGAEHAAAGADIALEMYARNDWLATSGSSYWDPLAAITLDHPEVASWADVRVEVLISGTEAGRIVRADDGRLIRAAMSADAGAFMTLFLAALRTGAPRR